MNEAFLYYQVLLICTLSLPVLRVTGTFHIIKPETYFFSNKWLMNVAHVVDEVHKSSKLT